VDVVGEVAAEAAAVVTPQVTCPRFRNTFSLQYNAKS
jgi:hypothetical protein